MQNGRIVESGKTEEIFTNPTHAYTKILMTALPKPLKNQQPPGPLLLRTENLNCRFETYGGWVHPFKRKKKIIKAVDNVTLDLYQGTTCGIVGESGSGKTTLGLAHFKTGAQQRRYPL